MGATVTPMLDVPSLRLGRFHCAPTDELLLIRTGSTTRQVG